MRATDCSTEPGGEDVVPRPQDVPPGTGTAGPGPAPEYASAFDDAA